MKWFIAGVVFVRCLDLATEYVAAQHDIATIQREAQRFSESIKIALASR